MFLFIKRYGRSFSINAIENDVKNDFEEANKKERERERETLNIVKICRIALYCIELIAYEQCKRSFVRLKEQQNHSTAQHI